MQTLLNVQPEAFITQNKQRLKQFIDKIYLKDNSNFEIELFNPLTEKIKSEITLNKVTIGSIVLRPGERIYLDRFFDSPNKFIFKTYEVENNNNIIDNAIRFNGDIEINFYDTPNKFIIKTYEVGNINNKENNYLNLTSINGLASYTTTYTTYNNLTSYTTTSTSDHSLQSNKETGIIVKGEKSNQTFSNDNSNFNFYPSLKIKLKILPISEKEFTSDDIKIYCTKCGRKKSKQSDNFCGTCGTKF
jgi:hypothetical protein